MFQSSRREQVEKTFLKHTHKTDGCWLWTGSTAGKYKYGRTSFGGTRAMAHRAAWWLYRGEPIPNGMWLDHLCGNRLCVNPDHLEITTPQKNILRSDNTAAQHNRKTHCPRGHLYDRIYATTGRRGCSICDKAYFARRYQERKVS